MAVITIVSASRIPLCHIINISQIYGSIKRIPIIRRRAPFAGDPYVYRKEDPPVTIQQARAATVSAPVYTLPVRR